MLPGRPWRSRDLRAHRVLTGQECPATRLPDWRRLAAAIRADPWGPTAQQVLEAVEISRPYGTSELLTAVIEHARRETADAERNEVAGEIRDLVMRSGLSRQDFALRLGTSRPRLSTYMSGKVTPSASLLLRMRRVAAQAQARVQASQP
jgi:DNA-binding transcriptional regulator YiaG